MADRIRSVAIAAIVLPVLFLAMSGFARAASIVVNTLDGGTESVPGPCSLTDAVAAANAGGTVKNCIAGSGANAITFSVTGTISTAALLDITDTQLTITGPAGGITIDGSSSHEIVKADTGTTVTLTNLTFAHGSTSGGGGAIDGDGTALEIDNCTFNNNDAGEIGGAVEASAGTVTITNSTFASNDGTLEGGGVGNAGSLLKITNSTFSGNEAVKGGALYTFSGTTDVKSTIFAASTGGNCGTSAVTNDEGYNLSDDTSGCFSAATSKNNFSNLNLDPTGLQNNGGPTKTIALESDSGAVDFIPVASCTDQSAMPQPLTTDQRGLPRPDPGNPNFCDAGAFELTTMPFAIAPNSERLQIARSTNPPGLDQINTAFTFIENGFPTCDEGTDAFNGFFVVFVSGTCAVENGSIAFFLRSWVVHTVNKESYGTLFGSFPPAGTVSARMVELPKPAPPACGEWTLNLEIAGIDSMLLGDGPFSLVLFNGDGGQQCFDITNAIVGNQIPIPGHGVRRVRRR